MSTDTGAPWSIPIPSADDSDPPNGPAQLGGIATTTASLLGRAFPCTSSGRPSHVAGLIIYETDTDELRVSDGASWNTVWYDSGVVASGFTAQTGWSNTDCYYQVLGSIAFVHIEVQRTGSTLTTNGTTGHLADENTVQVPAAAVNATNWVWGSGTMSGTNHFSWRLRADNRMFVLVSSWSLGVNIASGDYLTADFITVPG